MCGLSVLSLVFVLAIAPEGDAERVRGDESLRVDEAFVRRSLWVCRRRPPYIDEFSAEDVSVDLIAQLGRQTEEMALSV